MRAGMMLPAMADLDSAGFEAIEFVVPSAQFARAVRDLKEDPWVWIRKGAALAKRTPLRLHGSIGPYFANVPLCIQELFLDKLREVGISTTRTSDPWNDFDNSVEEFDLLRRKDFGGVINLIYSVSPRHTADYYAARTRQALKLRPMAICFKDVGGLLTPDAARELIPVVLREAGDVDVEFHAHCNNGLAPFTVMIAAESGIKTIHTAIPPLANGSSQPSVFNVVENLRSKGFNVDLDLAPLERVRDHFYSAAKDEGLPQGIPNEFDQGLYRHQVPGGMISNMVFQLEKLGMGDRINEVLEETARVREELGYPIMVTPLSQIVGTQAAINVVTGQRYGIVSDEVIEYAMGYRGREATDVMDQNIRDVILGRSRADEVRARHSAGRGGATLEEVRRQYGGKCSDDELIVRVFAGVGDTELDLDHGEHVPQSYDEYKASRRSVKDLVHELVNSDHGMNYFRYHAPHEKLLIAGKLK